MELQHLRSFLEVSSELSFTRAARNLNYAQSSVTAQIQHLEASLGVALFDRQGRRIALTDSGERLRPMAERIVALADHAHRELTAREHPRHPARRRPEAPAGALRPSPALSEPR
ncbi:LysR family transcriptional regulator [Kitasatospora sp. NPDC057223]|uniref:LysR family transcriptional regulator n=1 Tax=Kitasatospora sp. NPDC057223 TaxID=3346055 RepID=UPI00363F9555